MHPALMTEDRRLRYLHPLGSPALTQQGLSSFSPEQADPRTPSVSAACPSPPPNSSPQSPSAAFSPCPSLEYFWIQGGKKVLKPEKKSSSVTGDP